MTKEFEVTLIFTVDADSEEEACEICLSNGVLEHSEATVMSPAAGSRKSKQG